MLVMLTAPWCGACKTLYPEIQKAATKMGLPLKIIDVEDDPAEAGQFNAEALPTVLRFTNGVETHRIVGAYRSDRLLTLLGA